MDIKKCFLLLNFFLLQSSIFCEAQNVQASTKVVVKELTSTTLWCSSDKIFKQCVWQLPNGKQCSFEANRQESCIYESKVSLNSESTKQNCSISVTEVNDEFNGPWKCVLVGMDSRKVDIDIEMIVAVDAKVEFEDHFGTVTQIFGKPNELSCLAKHGRPIGKFVWRIGEEYDEDKVILENTNPITEYKDKGGYLNGKQILNYDPLIEHSEKRLYCTYYQFDENEIELYKDEDHITLSILYLKEPSVLKSPNTATEGESLNITVKIEAKPMPINTDITWVIEQGSRIIEVNLDNYAVEKKQYVGHPLVAVGDSIYEATLTINNIQVEEKSYTHKLKVSSRNGETNLIFSTKEVQVNIDVYGGNPGISDNQQVQEVTKEKSANVGMIVGIVVGVIVLVLLIAGVTFYSKKNHILCFKNENVYRTYEKDMNLEMPLHDADPNERPIIKAGARPPETHI